MWAALLGIAMVAGESQTVDCVVGGVAHDVRPEGGQWTTADGGLLGEGVGRQLVAGHAFGAGDFRVRAALTIWRLAGSAASVVFNGRSHFGFSGANLVPFVAGPLCGGQTVHLTDQAGCLADGRPFLFEAVRERNRLTVSIDQQVVWSHVISPDAPVFVAIRPHRARVAVHEWRLTGRLVAPPAPRRGSPGYTVPTIDLSTETNRQVVIARGSATVYQGHPHTLLMPDRRTMYAVWTMDHGGACGPMKRSDDGGSTWSELLPVPANWHEWRNCPTIHRLVDPQGVARLFVFAGNGDMVQSVSLDEGRTWTPFERNGLHTIVAPITIEPIRGGRLLMVYHRGRSDRDIAPLTLWQSVSADGGLTWQSERQVGSFDWADPCEPATVRSPDGRQLAVIARENSRRYNSLLMTSDDEGETWSPLREVPGSLTGDRHLPRYAADGRLVMVFRDTTQSSPTAGDFVGWVGTYADLVAGREGQYRFRLLNSPVKGDLGYPGLELLPDGTFVATTYAVLREGERNSVVSVRFKLSELDAKAKG